MVIEISPELEARAQRIVESGRYASVEECLMAAIELKLELDRRFEEILDVHREKIDTSSVSHLD